MTTNGEVQLRSLKRKDIRAYKKLFFKFHGRLVLFANKFTGDMQVSQDLVQDAFLNLWKQYNSQTKIKSPKAYLFQAVRNSCLNHHRHLKIRNSVEEELTDKIVSKEKSVYYDNENPYQSLLELELHEKIEELENSIPDRCKQVYKMSRHDFLKQKQIAKELGISVKMVEKHISKALLILRSGLTGYIEILILLLLDKMY